MRYNFWSKLYFYIQFLTDINSSIKYTRSASQSSMSLLFVFFCFCFKSLSVAVAAKAGINHVACKAPDYPFWAWYAGVTSNLKQYNQKYNHPGLFPQKCLCTSSQIWDELNVVWRTEKRFFRYIRGLQPSHLMNLLQTKLAKSYESYLVEFSLFGTGLAFFKTILDASLRTLRRSSSSFLIFKTFISLLPSYNHHSNFQVFWQFLTSQ